MNALDLFYISAGPSLFVIGMSFLIAIVAKWKTLKTQNHPIKYLLICAILIVAGILVTYQVNL